MQHYKYLLKNIGILTISSFGTKILSFLLVPVYTNILTTAEYGTFDIYNTTISLLIPILTLNVSSSVMRFSLDKDADFTTIFSVGITYLLKGTALLSLGIFLNEFFNVVSISNAFIFFFITLFIVDALLQTVIMFARGLERINDIAVSGIISTALTIVFNIIFLIPLEMGLNGYFMATLIGLSGNCFYLIIKSRMWQYISFININKTLEKEMLAYSIPLIANSIAWWVNSASDRYVIVLFCGIGANGIYSIASKIPSILNMFQSIFNQAWNLSAVKDFDSEDSDGFFSKIYNSYNIVMVISCSIFIVFNRPLAAFLYNKEFYIAWKYVPFLMIAIVFGALSGYIGGVFSAVRDSSIFAKTTIIGAIANIFFNIVLTIYIGPLGAAISTAISYWLVWAIRYHKMKNYINIKINIFRDYCTYLILVVQSILLLIMTQQTIYLYTMELILFITIVLLFWKDIWGTYQLLKEKFIKNKTS